MDCNLKKIANFIELFLCIWEKSLRADYGFYRETTQCFLPVLMPTKVQQKSLRHNRLRAPGYELVGALVGLSPGRLSANTPRTGKSSLIAFLMIQKLSYNKIQISLNRVEHELL